MNDPYAILGVSVNATEEQIKDAYREKAKKYHEDSYAGGQAAVNAEKKLRELDDAYDEIMSRLRTGNSYNTNTNTYGYTPPTYAGIRNAIMNNDLDNAQIMLNNIPENERIAEWYYLQGMIQQRKGWINAAYENFETAYRMDPSNPEYTRAYQNMNAGRNGGYRTSGGGRRSDSDCSFCNICQGLICADCCCECMGGDLIRCC